MPQFDRILLPTDFSRTARRALSFAAHLADRHGGTLHLLHVRSPAGERSQPSGAEAPTTRDELAECARRAAEGLGDPTATHGHEMTMVRDSVTAESVPEAVLDYAEAHDVDLVVMGTARRTGLRTLFPQSTASAVVRHASCPVLTVLDEPDVVPSPIDHIFVPYDFSAHAAKGLRAAEKLAEVYEATVTLIHVVQDLRVPLTYEVQGADVDSQDLHAQAETALREVAADRHRVLVAPGHPAGRIVELADDHHADLIVQATHGRTGLRRVLLGSVAERVLRRARCPVFTVRAFPSSEQDGSGKEETAAEK